MNSKAALAFFGLFALVGTIFAIIAYLDWQSTQNLIKTGIQTKGVVIDNVHSQDKQGRTETSVAPVVRFTTTDGTPITYYSRTYSTPPSFVVGQQVTLWYPPDNPQDALLEGAEGWLLPLIFGIFGVVFIPIGVIGLFFTLRKTLNRQPI